MILVKFIKINLILQKFNMIEDIDFNEICEVCERKDESVIQNLIMHGYKICKSCNLSKTIFPIGIPDEIIPSDPDV